MKDRLVAVPLSIYGNLRIDSFGYNYLFLMSSLAICHYNWHVSNTRVSSCKFQFNSVALLYIYTLSVNRFSYAIHQIRSSQNGRKFCYFLLIIWILLWFICKCIYEYVGLYVHDLFILIKFKLLVKYSTMLGVEASTKYMLIANTV